MIVSPASIALWLSSVAMLIFYLITTLFGYNIIEPWSTIIFYLLFQEMAKFVAEMQDGD